MKRGAPALALAAALALTASGAASSKVTATTVLAVEHWVGAVERHQPGTPDQALIAAASLAPDDWGHLGDGLPLFLSALTGKGPTTSNDAEKRVAEVGADAGRAPGANAFLARAAVLHTDLVVLAGRLPVQPSPSGPRPNSEKPLVQASDGEYQVLILPNWNWIFARSLLDLVGPKPADDPFVGTWYHATAAYLMAANMYGEVGPHLNRAAALLPDDARILFDRACLSEALALPRSQQVLSDPRTQDALNPQAPNMAPGRPQPMFVPGQQVPRWQANLRDPTESESNAQAERLYRRALEEDPSVVEARVRLGRLLVIRKRYAEAAAELAAALQAAHDPTVVFYAHLFAARAAAGLGQLDTAAAHAREALAISPGAQSALLEASDVALRRADASGALVPIGTLAALPDDADPRRDPWWVYAAGPGRESDALLGVMWKAVPR